MTAALLVIDVQESFRARADWARISDPDIAAHIAPLVEHARASGDHVVWVLHTEPGSGGLFDPGNPAVTVMSELEPEPGEAILHKTSHNAFTTTDLAQRLTRWGVDEVVVTGIRTEQCCETTARVASDLGYRVRFVLDATATHPLPRFGGGDELSAAEVMTRTASALSGRFATIVTREEVLGRARPAPSLAG